LRNPPNERLTRQPRTPAKAGGQEKNSSPAQAGAQEAEESGPRPSPGHNHQHVPERKCILSGAHDTRSDLIRLALGPDGSVAPDIRARAPGRGAWIGVDRSTLEQAQARGKLKAALSRAFKTGEISIPLDLGERIEANLRKAALDRLGLEARAGTLLTGSEKIEVAARRGGVHMLLHASDAGEDGSRRLDQALRVGESGAEPLVFPAERAILSLALGRQNVVHIALIDRAAAARVRHALDRWRAFIGPNAGLSAATAGAPDAAAVDVNEG
jgi:predicted RNA-binding protein YlxR (DUF448 family)